MLFGVHSVEWNLVMDEQGPSIAAPKGGCDGVFAALGLSFHLPDNFFRLGWLAGLRQVA